MLCLRNETCHKDMLFCCYSCEVVCSTKNDCNDEECINNPNNITNKKEQDIKQKDDIEWLIKELNKAGQCEEADFIDFGKIKEIAERNGIEIN